MAKTTPAVHRYNDQLSNFTRDEYGLLNCVDYIFNADNTINWRKMINKDYLVRNREAKGSADVDVSTLPDNQLLILLAGIKELAQIRGYVNVDYEVLQAQPDYVAVKCTIDWLPNFETFGERVSFSSLADAHLDNTKDFAKSFLMAIAENRAFIRAVRSFLKINIVGNDEMGKTTHIDKTIETATAATQPIALLQKTIDDNGLTFDQIKARAVQKKMAGAEAWTSSSDIPPLSMFSIISAIKSKNKK